MARIIEFHIPAGFKPKTLGPQQERGTLGAFPVVDSNELAELKPILCDDATVTVLANVVGVGAVHHC